MSFTCKNAFSYRNSYWQLQAIGLLYGLKKSICWDIC